MTFNEISMTTEELCQHIEMLHSFLMNYMLFNKMSKMEAPLLNDCPDGFKLNLSFYVDNENEVLRADLKKGDELEN